MLARIGVGGILGDDMGLGKTVQTTVFLIAVLGKKATIQDKCPDEEFMEDSDRKGPVLIVCPASLLIQVT
jgi:SNF2 family DNA or RNA helicase